MAPDCAYLPEGSEEEKKNIHKVHPLDPRPVGARYQTESVDERAGKRDGNTIQAGTEEIEQNQVNAGVEAEELAQKVKVQTTDAAHACTALRAESPPPE